MKYCIYFKLLCAYWPQLLTLEAISRWKCLSHCFTGCLSTLKDRRCIETFCISVYIQEKHQYFIQELDINFLFLGMGMGMGGGGGEHVFAYDSLMGLVFWPRFVSNNPTKAVWPPSSNWAEDRLGSFLGSPLGLYTSRKVSFHFPLNSRFPPCWWYIPWCYIWYLRDLLCFTEQHAGGKVILVRCQYHFKEGFHFCFAGLRPKSCLSIDWFGREILIRVTCICSLLFQDRTINDVSRCTKNDGYWFISFIGNLRTIISSHDRAFLLGHWFGAVIHWSFGLWW